jgi:hypothetical protein
MKDYRVGQAKGWNWHMLTLVGTGTTTKIYMDGADTTGTMNKTLTTNPLGLIGGHLQYAGNRNFAQYIDDVYVYPTALSATDIQNLYSPPSSSVNFPATAIAATADSTLDLTAASANHTLGNVTVTAGASANTTLTVSNVNKLTIGTLTIGINGAYYGKLNLGAKELTLGNGSVTKLAVTSVSPTGGTCCVAVAADGSFDVGLNGTQVTDNNGNPWRVSVVDDGTMDQLWLTAEVFGTVLEIR